jgi:Glycosyltransferases, probably involved in cell wall biogenesis
MFFIFYAYQFIYVLVRFVKKMPKFKAEKLHKFAVIIAARNERIVIGGLIDSIIAQKYPRELVDIIVVADNCTDDTAQIARDHGANIVIERFNQQKVGKGYALNYAFEYLDNSCGIKNYDGYIVFDADNLLDENYISEMNAVFDKGYRVVTSYRNSKNYGSNWISAGSSLWYLRESKFLNGARMLCNTSCAISGTGFLVSSDIIEEDKGWKYHLLTEDIEFTTSKIIEGEVIGYSESAVLYDEQPVDFDVSWKQRMRWSKGFYQVLQNYGAALFKGIFRRDGFKCYDMFSTIAPAGLLTIASIVLNSIVCLYGVFTGHELIAAISFLEVGASFRNVYLSLFFFGLLTTITEWKNIHCSNPKKILYVFTFPIFMFTYLPIALAALFKNVTWEPIRHTFVERAAVLQHR